MCFTATAGKWSLGISLGPACPGPRRTSASHCSHVIRAGAARAGKLERRELSPCEAKAFLQQLPDLPKCKSVRRDHCKFRCPQKKVLERLAETSLPRLGRTPSQRRLRVLVPTLQRQSSTTSGDSMKLRQGGCKHCKLTSWGFLLLVLGFQACAWPGRRPKV